MLAMLFCYCEGRRGERHTEPLVHGVGVLSPLGELGAESRELLGVGLDVSGIFIEEDLQNVISFHSLQV